VADGWTDIFGRFQRGSAKHGAEVDHETRVRTLELVDFEKMEQVRARAEELVEDPHTAEALKPYYRQFCKRPCFHDEYLQTFNRPNVTLVDTEGRGVERITERGIVANGVEYEVDCIVYASGFEVGTPIERRAGYQIHGRDGRTLSEKWQNGVSTLYGMQTRGFPNCFLVATAQAGMSANFPHVLEVQSRHIAYLIQQAREREVNTMDVSAEAEAAWVQTVIDSSLASLRFLEACTPGYYNNEGRPNGELIRQNGNFGHGIMAYAKILEDWRAEGSLAGLELTRA
jgi:cyclohexanone monooxygenase